MFNIGGFNGLGDSSWSWIINLIIVIVVLEFLVNILSCNNGCSC